MILNIVYVKHTKYDWWKFRVSGMFEAEIFLKKKMTSIGQQILVFSFPYFLNNYVIFRNYKAIYSYFRLAENVQK